ncbi:efflux RND transporter periplasmic adaptor subunit [Rhodohalobacter sp. 8-1]|uniref:efflux RND transporter periplasmic adaptor subunit n=1 Tax=Rhodohalobacter sp. 8-1 TaxID=3131972 RepID=UPI0030EE689B
MKMHFKLPLLVALTIFLLFQGCAGEDQTAEENADAIRSIPVEVSNVTRGDISAYYSNTATLEAEQEATVVSKVRGIIEELHVEEGDAVREGQILAKIDDEQYRIEANRAEATLKRLENDFQRNKELFDKNLISAETFQNSRYEYESQKATHELALLNLEYTTVRSPISGVISERFVKRGNMIGTDQQLYRVTDFSPLTAVLHVPEHEMSKINKNQRVELRADALPNQLFVGHVERISPVVNQENGTFKVTAYVDETDGLLRPGMFSRVRIVYDTRQNTRMIPRASVISEDLNQSVFVIRDSLAFKKQIQTGYTNGRNIEVTEGLDDNEMVVTIGQSSLQDSSKVSIINNSL